MCHSGAVYVLDFQSLQPEGQMCKSLSFPLLCSLNISLTRHICKFELHAIIYTNMGLRRLSHQIILILRYHTNKKRKTISRPSCWYAKLHKRLKDYQISECHKLHISNAHIVKRAIYFVTRKLFFSYQSLMKQFIKNSDYFMICLT